MKCWIDSENYSTPNYQKDVHTLPRLSPKEQLNVKIRRLSTKIVGICIFTVDAPDRGIGQIKSSYNVPLGTSIWLHMSNGVSV